MVYAKYRAPDQSLKGCVSINNKSQILFAKKHCRRQDQAVYNYASEFSKWKNVQ